MIHRNNPDAVSFLMDSFYRKVNGCPDGRVIFGAGVRVQPMFKLVKDNENNRGEGECGCGLCQDYHYHDCDFNQRYSWGPMTRSEERQWLVHEDDRGDHPATCSCLIDHPMNK